MRVEHGESGGFQLAIVILAVALATALIIAASSAIQPAPLCLTTPDGQSIYLRLDAAEPATVTVDRPGTITIQECGESRE